MLEEIIRCPGPEEPLVPPKVIAHGWISYMSSKDKYVPVGKRDFVSPRAVHGRLEILKKNKKRRTTADTSKPFLELEQASQACPRRVWPGCPPEAHIVLTWTSGPCQTGEGCSFCGAILGGLVATSFECGADRYSFRASTDNAALGFLSPVRYVLSPSST